MPFTGHPLWPFKAILLHHWQTTQPEDLYNLKNCLIKKNKKSHQRNTCKKLCRDKPGSLTDAATGWQGVRIGGNTDRGVHAAIFNILCCNIQYYMLQYYI